MKNIHLISILLGGTLLLNGCSSLIPWGSKKTEKQAFWRQIGTDSKTNAKYAVDLNSKKKNGQIVNINSRITYPQSVQAPKNLSLPSFSSMVIHWEFNCDAKTYKLLKTDFVNEKGSIVHQQTFLNADAKYIGAPETAAGIQYKLACSKK